MKHKMITTFQLLLCLILILNGGISTCKPLSSEDVESLLPPTPRDKNETIAAVVQDPVVQDAVQKAASNGSLNGLVVKKNVFIMPASNPNMILSKREHILVVPTENLEDVRKNITETKQTEAATETSSPESEMSIESDADEYMPEEIESGPQQNMDLQSSPEGNPSQSMSTNEKLKSKTEFLEDAISHDIPLPEDQPKKVPVPIIAVIDPSKAEKGKVNSPIVAILPNQMDNDVLKNQVQFLNDNNDVIQKKAQNYIDQSSLTIVPDYRKSSTPSEITLDLSSIQETVPVPVSSWSFQQEDSLKPITMSRWEMIVPAYQDDNMDYSREKGDMDVAEDIVFRPLFRYRQQMQQRSKYYDESNRRYGGYSNNYPRRAYFYRPRYDNY
ncbi:uncharacterized protein LOC114882446 isoform X1 [Osmia bicornis bicornis]|uniref:uncharacterized protein LOC114882446 isoform X1 n=1 Tax=Osmia bicornis bicornis TaxID=1437191 RepID=UPI0010F647A1|nr:uncharacterized protein LOC114882446 isoform X1 [Osmia bicornis bicornis]